LLLLQLRQNLLIALQMPALVVDFTIPMQIKAFKTTENGVTGAADITRAVQIVYPQQPKPVMLAGVQITG